MTPRKSYPFLSVQRECVVSNYVVTGEIDGKLGDIRFETMPVYLHPSRDDAGDNDAAIIHCRQQIRTLLPVLAEAYAQMERLMERHARLMGELDERE